ncbi:uncharacterized protein F4807DRAFT_81774 [Annulohypoxylon truncatum]|uniref:uncharacterized protein n=1 Tax=Annulohypoxylon truncatum TaxID=327061 RepID=UPI0020077E26|nr:uncharacterized protein F4807DRAFT_81774 [Annulohypoxylon truncatum]KAI1210013.1 hypothetical protein F4807DRAFT_81774 [Annulohypoxylon truncatum]
MLLRQLQRPSSRSLAALAAWRPTLAATAPLHGSSRRQESKSTPPPSPDESEPKSDQDDEQPTSTPASTSSSPSLFEKFFPNEAKQARLSSNPWSSPLFPEPPDTPPEIPDLSDLDIDTEPTSTSTSTSGEVPLRAKSMLILSAASASLVEPDFLRLGPQGYHVEGWVSGITRVVQARDPDTLRPLGHYFVLFDSDESALAYQAEVARLWSLAKRHAQRPAGRVGMHWSRKYNDSKNRGGKGKGPPAGALPPDVAAQIKGFTLVPPSQKYQIGLSTAASTAKIEDLDIGGASFVDRLADRAGSRHLVLVKVDGGRIPVDMLRQAIEEDGVERNLAWRVTDLRHGILAFGTSGLKKADRAAMEQADEEEEGEVGDDRKYRRYPRFVVPFRDSAEAHRFVRGWHRRQLKIRMHAEGESKMVSWDETRILNTSVLW